MTFVNVHSPVFRLTLWYVLLIMAISVMFSVFIYRLTAFQVQQSFPARPRFYIEFGSHFSPPLDDRVAELFENRYREVMERLKASLLLLNAGVLGTGALASYFLAKRTLRPIENALDQQRRFAADASHELRTPLAAMKTEIEVSLHDKTQTDHTQVLKSNLEEISKLEYLSTSLLQLARHEDEQQRPVKERVQVSEFVEDAYRRVSALAEKKHITIVRNAPTGAVLGNRAGLADLLVILLDNAIKYSPDNSTVHIHGSLTRQHLVLNVTDHGTGVAAKDLPHIFERFYRVDTSRSKKRTDGYGLGLSIAQQIVDLHSGSIIAESTEGKGTTIIVTLPRA